MSCNPVLGLCMACVPRKNQLLHPSPNPGWPGLGLRHPDFAFPNTSGIRSATKREKRLSLAGQQGPAGQGIVVLYSFSKYCMLGPALSALPVLAHGFSPTTQQQGDHNIFSFYTWETAAQRAYNTCPRLLSTGTQGPYCAKVVLTTIFSHFGASWRVWH